MKTSWRWPCRACRRCPPESGIRHCRRDNRDENGCFFILDRTDDLINVVGHRLGTREIELSISSHPNVAEVVVVGVADTLKGQVAMAFVVLKDPSKAAAPADALKQEGELMKLTTTEDPTALQQIKDLVGGLSFATRVRRAACIREPLISLCRLASASASMLQ